MKNSFLFYLSILLCLFSCVDDSSYLFNNYQGKELGVHFINEVTETNELNILDYIYFYNGGGTAIGDINNDGLPDVFLVANQLKNKLYLNKGGLKFEDISKNAGVAGTSSWNTGTVMADVNNDGFLDIYVCSVVGINNFIGKNELYINNGDLTFTESASKYNLDFESFGTSAAFFDYDKDGDLDMYMLNHAIHTPGSFGKAESRRIRNEFSGDKLMRNDGDSFTDVSVEAGIIGGASSYGLGLSISDFNNDGWPDIYVGNDFHEDDYFYLNNGDGTFSEKLTDYFGHTSKFSMGNDAGDINNDGWQDLISLDMSPEDETLLKSSAGDDNFQVQKMRTDWYGYHYQFARNMLYVNQGDKSFAETALISGVSATDWSWSALFGDYNQDGIQDLFVSNGIPKRPNNLDFIKYISSDKMGYQADKAKLVDQKTLEMMPSGRTHNYIFKGRSDLKFSDKSGIWMEEDAFVSGATAYGDLDNDGDLDLVVNNFNDEVAFYINQTNETKNYLKIKLEYSEHNLFGFGTKIYAYSNGQLQFKELFPARGFQSSSEPIIHFGFNDTQTIDSLKIIWPNNSFQVMKNVDINNTLTISPNNTMVYDYTNHLTQSEDKLFEEVDGSLGINIIHEEDSYVDFNRQKLIPFMISDRGPATAIGDLNGDSKKDVFFGGSKQKNSRIFIQQDSGFVEKEYTNILKESVKEDVVALIEDFNGDAINDLYIGSGGGDFYNESEPLNDSYFINNSDEFEKQKLPKIYNNASVIKASDFDNDGDLDLFVGNQAISNNYGALPDSHILINNDGEFKDSNFDFLKNIGMITDAVWDDFDRDGKLDLIVVGEWMKPRFYRNMGSEFVEQEVGVNNLNGLWQSIIPFDIDEDGDTDYLLGNWGENSKFKASADEPMLMYHSDFDGNGSTETIVCTSKEGEYYPLMGLDKLSSQLEFLKKKYTAYDDFAGQNIERIFGRDALNNAQLSTVHNLSSGYLKSNEGTFDFIPFPEQFQVAPVTTFLAYDYDSDGKEEVLMAGNYFGVTPYHGRFDSFSGGLLSSEDDITLSNRVGLDLSGKPIIDLNIITYKDNPYLLVTVNNAKVEIYRLIQK